MNQSKAYLKSSSKHFTTRSVNSYVSRLNRALKILRIEPSEFYSINDPDKVRSLMDEFRDRPEFKRMNEGSRNDIMSSFRRHIEAVQILENLKPATLKYLEEYLTSYKAYLDDARHKQAAINSLLTGLVAVLSTNFDPELVDSALLKILKVEGIKSLTDIHEVALELSGKDFNLAVFNHFDTTAKVMALKGLIRQLNVDVKVMDNED